ncbi:MAG TPA: hypothetical protein VGA56_22410, partial [Opitutaceae bacterium]
SKELLSTHSKERPELIRRQAGVACDGAHCDRVDRVVPGNDQTDFAVAHNDVTRLSGNPVSELLEHTDGILLADA